VKARGPRSTPEALKRVARGAKQPRVLGTEGGTYPDRGCRVRNLRRLPRLCGARAQHLRARLDPAPFWKGFGAAMSSSPWEWLWIGDEDVATPLHGGSVKMRPAPPQPGNKSSQDQYPR
jgi:hypothetical protein